MHCSQPAAKGGRRPGRCSRISCAGNPMDGFVTGMEQRGNGYVNGHEPGEFARQAWTFAIARASTRNSGANTGPWRRCTGADINGLLTASPHGMPPLPGAAPRLPAAPCLPAAPRLPAAVRHARELYPLLLHGCHAGVVFTNRERALCVYDGKPCSSSARERLSRRLDA